MRPPRTVPWIGLALLAALASVTASQEDEWDVVVTATDESRLIPEVALPTSGLHVADDAGGATRMEDLLRQYRPKDAAILVHARGPQLRPPRPGFVEFGFTTKLPLEKGMWDTVLFCAPQLAGSLSAGAIRFGEDPPVLVGGTVVDDAGEPVPDALLDVRVIVTDEFEFPLDRTPVRTDSAGRFTVLRDVRGARGLRIFRYGTRGLRDTTVVAPGAADTLVPWNGDGAVTCAVEIPKGVDLEGLDVHLHGANGIPPDHGADTVRILESERTPRGSPRGSLVRAVADERVAPAAAAVRFARLPPGEYEATLTPHGSPLVLGRVPPFVVGAGEWTTGPLRLAREPRRVTIHLLDPQGGPVPGGRVWFREKGSGALYRSAVSAADGGVTVDTWGTELDLAASSHGARFTFKRTRADDVNVQASRARLTPVTLHARRSAADSALPHEGPPVLVWVAEPGVEPSDLPTRPDPSARGRDTATDPRAAIHLETDPAGEDTYQAVVLEPGWYAVVWRTGASGYSYRSDHSRLSVDGSGRRVVHSILP